MFTKARRTFGFILLFANNTRLKAKKKRVESKKRKTPFRQKN